MTHLLRARTALAFFGSLALIGATAYSTAQGANYVVTTTDDVINGSDGLLSLREAVLSANAVNGATNITVPAGTYLLTGYLDLTGHVSISGAGADVTFVDGAGVDRAFVVEAGADAALSGLTVRNGLAVYGAGILVAGEGTLALSNCVVTGNAAAVVGGGIAVVTGELTVQESVISGNSVPINSANSAGGGIYSLDAEVTICGSMLSGNSARRGGAFYSESLTVDFGFQETVIQDSTISDNNAGDGAGICKRDYGTLAVRNCTLSGNLGGNGAAVELTEGETTVQNCDFINNAAGAWGGSIALFSSSSLTVSDSTFTGNTAGLVGGAIFVSGSGVTNVRESVLTGNSAGQAGGGIWVSSGNLVLRESIVTGNSAPSGGDLYDLGNVQIIDSDVGDIAP